MVAWRMYKHLVPYPAARGGICPLGKPKNSGSACKLCGIFVTEKSLSEWMMVFLIGQAVISRSGLAIFHNYFHSLSNLKRYAGFCLTFILFHLDGGKRIGTCI